ncbi:MBL fold metallo-hydrolase [Streptomyces sp. NBC_01795]|nr:MULTISPECIES: MBL fold metallo-hydrolase [unclassified Streptomyces]WSA92193.1 MBL fold metallo-hydrolase [Streptomyces sp. NBC_01795]WSB76559.1 MBL fold metallo-hydrolase [Streptomyces sp. NBC_01775]WSS15153.1 MBL fold metallo-hydrolase [Streptomyces sp. NBC_01186]
MTLTPSSLRKLGNGLHLWNPPRRGWGLANCGLLVGDGTGLWIDTPYDRPLAEAFLAASREVLGGAEVDRIVVTHANGDHLWGADVLPDAEVIATREARHHIDLEPSPRQLRQLSEAAGSGSAVGSYIAEHFGHFDWSRTEVVVPSTVFEGELELTVGGHPVLLTSLPSAHTTGDLVVQLPDHGTVFTGDIVFGSTPEHPGDHAVHWAGPLENIIGACQGVLDSGAETIVPGHGPVLDRAGLRSHIDYLSHLRERAHASHARGVSALEAARAIAHEGLRPELGLVERLVVTIGTEYRHLDGTEPGPLAEVLPEMVAFAAERGA